MNEQLVLIEKFYTAMFPTFKQMKLPDDFYWDTQKGLLHKQKPIFQASDEIKAFTIQKARNVIRKAFSNENPCNPDYRNQVIERLRENKIHVEDFKNEDHAFHYVYSECETKKQNPIHTVDPLVEEFCKYADIPESEKDFIRSQPDMRERIEFLYQTLGHHKKKENT